MNRGYGGRYGVATPKPEVFPGAASAHPVVSITPWATPGSGPTWTPGQKVKHLVTDLLFDPDASKGNLLPVPRPTTWLALAVGGVWLARRWL